MEHNFVKNNIFDEILFRKDVFLNERGVYPTRIYVGGSYRRELLKGIESINVPHRNVTGELDGETIYGLEIRTVGTNILEVV